MTVFGAHGQHQEPTEASHEPRLCADCAQATVRAQTRSSRVGYRPDVGAGGRASLGWRRATATAAIVLAVLLPALRNRDSFPLSTYPVYANARGSTVTLSTAIGIDGAGADRRLSLDVIGRTDDPLIAESAVDQAIAEGRADVLCADIAGRAPDGVVTIEVVEERHDAVARVRRETSLLERTVHARCAVAR